MTTPQSTAGYTVGLSVLGRNELRAIHSAGFAHPRALVTGKQLAEWLAANGQDDHSGNGATGPQAQAP